MSGVNVRTLFIEEVDAPRLFARLSRRPYFVHTYIVTKAGKPRSRLVPLDRRARLQERRQ